jgi:hypothetical protein
LRRNVAAFTRSRPFRARAGNRLVHRHIGELQAQHPDENIDERAGNVGGFLARPDSRQCQNDDDIIQATPEMRSLVGRGFHARFGSIRSSCAEFFKELVWLNEEWILLKDASNDDERVSAQDVEDDVAAEFGEIVRADADVA